jgi:hypothetical protein
VLLGRAAAAGDWVVELAVQRAMELVVETPGPNVVRERGPSMLLFVDGGVLIVWKQNTLPAPQL